MTPRRRAFVRALASGAALATLPALAQDPRASAAIAAARDWLVLTDRGEFAASHAKAGAKFKSVLDADRWTAALKKERGPRGALVTRTVVRSTFQTTLPGAPDGDYALVLFRTSFAKATDAAETVTLEREPDGAWRVVGYFIR